MPDHEESIAASATARGKYRRLQLLFIASAVAVAFMVRLAVALPGLGGAPEHFSRPDTGTYLFPALALCQDGAYNAAPGSAEPHTLRSPGFPVFLALVFGIFGVNYAIPVILLCLAGALICVPVFYTGRLLGGFRCGMVASLLFAFNITAIAMSPMYLSDSLFSLFVACQLLFFVRFFRRQSFSSLYVSVVMMALATLIRPISQVWIIPLAVLVLFRKGIPFRKRLAGTGWSALIFAGILFPWMWRNSQVGAGFCIDSNTGQMYHQNGAMLLSAVNGTDYELEKRHIEEQQEIEFSDKAKYPDVRSRTIYQNQKLRELAVKYPFTYARLHFQPQILIPDAATFFELLGLTQTGRGTLNVMHTQGIWAAVKHYFDGKMWLIAVLLPLLAVVALTYLGCLCQLLIWLAGRKIWLFFFFLAFVEYFLMLPGPITVPRYHLPALPLMTVMAGLALIRGRRVIFMLRNRLHR